MDTPRTPEPVPDVDPDRVRAVLADGDALGGFFAMSTRPEEAGDPSWRPIDELYEPPGATVDPDHLDEAGSRMASELERAHLEPLIGAVRARVSVSPRVMWGNAASSLAGAVRVLALERPHTRDRARALASAVLTRGRLAGLGGFVAEPTHPTGFGFLRRTCCLFHRVPGGGTCGDCVLR